MFRCKRFLKFQYHIFTDLIALLADRRSNGRIHISRICAICFLHFPNRNCTDFCNSPSPSGMRQANRMMHRINKIQRHTIRIKCCQHQTSYIRDHSIYICIRSGLHNPISAVLFCNNAYIRRMCLIRSHDISFRKAKCSRKSSVIFINSGILISSCKTEIHGCINPFTYSTQPCAESMHNIRKLFKCRICKPGHTFVFFYLHM